MMDTNAMPVGGLDAASDLGMTRRLPVPPEQVFAAWTRAERVRRRFGPFERVG